MLLFATTVFTLVAEAGKPRRRFSDFDFLSDLISLESALDSWHAAGVSRCTAWVLTESQHVAGHNTERLMDKSVNDCKVICKDRDWCKSFDYHVNANICDLSTEDYSSVPLTSNDGAYDNYKCVTYEEHMAEESNTMTVYLSGAIGGERVSLRPWRHNSAGFPDGILTLTTEETVLELEETNFDLTFHNAGYGRAVKLRMAEDFDLGTGAECHANHPRSTEIRGGPLGETTGVPSSIEQAQDLLMNELPDAICAPYRMLLWFGDLWYNNCLDFYRDVAATMHTGCGDIPWGGTIAVGIYE